MNLYYRYLEGCRNFNELNDLPEKGWEWHHTLPQCLFGDQPIGLWLTKEQHAKASVLQSYAFGVCCVTGMMKKHLPEGWKKSVTFWLVQQSRRVGKHTKGKKWWSKNGKFSRAHQCPGEGWVLSKPPSFTVLNSPEATRKKKEKLRGEGNGMFGKKLPESALRTKSEKMKGKLHWVNEEGKTQRARECPGPEWQRGRKWRPQ